MGWGQGFGGKAKPNVITAEAVKASASKAVQNLHTEADELRQEIEDKKKELAGIQPVIDVKFRQREEAVQSLEAAAKNKMEAAETIEAGLAVREKKLQQETGLLQKKREEFDLLMVDKDQLLEAKNQTLIDASTALDATRQKLQGLITEYGNKMGDIDVLKAEVAEARKVLDGDIAAWESKEKDLSARESALQRDRQVLQTARALNDDKEKEVRGLLNSQTRQLAEINEQLSKLADEKSKNKMMLLEIETREKGITDANKSISEERNRLHVWRATLQEDQKKIDEQMKNIKKLNAEVAK